MIEAAQTVAGWRPQREIELVAGTPAGGGQDRPARVLIELLKDLVPVPIRLTNIAGRGGGNAWDYLADHPGDAHILAINSPAIRIAFATAIGNMNHMALAKITRQGGGDVKALRTDVFDSARYAVAHVVEGRADLAVITATSAVPELDSGVLRAIAVSAPERMSGPFADVPTWGENGIDCVVGTWRGVIGTSGMTAPQIAFWENALLTAVRGEPWRAELARHHWEDTYLRAAATRDFLNREFGAMKSALAALGLLADSA
jgi:putative tricarboxylic transport membrane protein